MKRRFLKIAFVVAVAVVGGINMFNAQKSVELSDVAMANVEALADNEGTTSTDCDVYCEIDCRYDCIIIFSEGIESITCDGYRKKQQ